MVVVRFDDAPLQAFDDDKDSSDSNERLYDDGEEGERRVRVRFPGHFRTWQLNTESTISVLRDHSDLYFTYYTGW